MLSIVKSMSLLGLDGCLIYVQVPIIECPEASRKIQNGDEVEIDFNTGVIQDLTTGESFQGQAFPEFMQKIIAAEGLINYINSQE